MSRIFLAGEKKQEKKMTINNKDPISGMLKPDCLTCKFYSKTRSGTVRCYGCGPDLNNYEDDEWYIEYAKAKKEQEKIKTELERVWTEVEKLADWSDGKASAHKSFIQSVITLSNIQRVITLSKKRMGVLK